MAIVAMAVAACPEPQVCTQIGCATEPWIRVVDEGPGGGRLRAGDYTFRLESTLVTLEWTCALAGGDSPDSGCDRSALTAEGELEGEPVEWFVGATHGDDGLHITLVETREGGYIITGPDEFTITVIRDGEVVVAETHRPDYVGTWPNGRECGPYCGGASEPVVVRVPA